MTDNALLRSMVEPPFTREHVDKMRPQIQKLVDSLLDEILEHRSEQPMDLVEKFSLPVPSFVSFWTLTRVIDVSSAKPRSLFLANRSSMVS